MKVAGPPALTAQAFNESRGGKELEQELLVPFRLKYPDAD